MKFDKKAWVEAGQEVVRLAFFAVLGVVVSFLLNKLTVVPQTETTVVAMFFLKFVDKYLHENKYTELNGLTDSKLLGR